MYRILTTTMKTALAAGIVGLATLTATYAEPAKPVALPEAETERVVGLTTRDRTEIAFVVRAHISALSNRNADVLFHMAEPDFRAKFKDASHMLRILSILQGPFTVAADIRLDGLNAVDQAMPVQHVYVNDGKGRQWWAALRLKKTEAGAWHIHDWLIIPAPGELV